MSDVRAEILSDWPALIELSVEWNELLSASRADSLFLKWEWIEAWRAVLGASVQPFVVTARTADGRLLGILPFYLAKNAPAGRGSLQGAQGPG
jgi:CelD/BcsL family acetyltransferase involved in cellulose biosynthesis